MTWESMDTAPKDGTWILLRGRNAVGAPMIPVVAAWRLGGDGKYAWRDSAKLSDVSARASRSTGSLVKPLPMCQSRPACC